MDGAEIRAERVKRGWSLFQLGQLIGKSKGSISMWESGYRDPGEKAVRDLEEAFSGKRGEPPPQEPRGRRRRNGGRESGPAAQADRPDVSPPLLLISQIEEVPPADPYTTHEQTMMSVAEIIAERKKRGWSQQELANRVGIARGTLGNWESGARGSHPTPEHLRAIEEVFENNPTERNGEAPPSRRRGGRTRSRQTTPDDGSGAEPQKDMRWEEAIEKALRNSGKPMHYADIAQAIIDNGYRANVGATPANSVAAILSKSIRSKKDKSPFVSVGDGHYKLRTAKNKERPADQPRDEAKESAAEMGLIGSFGIFWDREWVDWQTTSPTLLGVKQAGSKPVDFAEQSGIYVLYDQSRPIYVGQAGDKRLGLRLKDHTRGRFSSRWNRFSWFGVRGVNPETGQLDASPSKHEIGPATLITTMEALLIESLEPPQNRRGGDYNAVEFIQEKDPSIKDRERDAYFKEVVRLLNPTTTRT